MPTPRVAAEQAKYLRKRPGKVSKLDNWFFGLNYEGSRCAGCPQAAAPVAPNDTIRSSNEYRGGPERTSH